MTPTELPSDIYTPFIADTAYLLFASEGTGYLRNRFSSRGSLDRLLQVGNIFVYVLVFIHKIF